MDGKPISYRYNLERMVIIVGVIFIALGMTQPNGVLSIFTSTYSIRLDYLAAAIVVGMFFKMLSRGNIPMRLVGVAPYTVFVFLALRLYFIGLTPLLQSQILYMVIWVAVCAPLLRDLYLLARQQAVRADK